MNVANEQVEIGRVVLVQFAPGKVWMTWTDDGEGMEVNEADLEAALTKFYNERF